MATEVSVLFSENNIDKFIVLLIKHGRQRLHDILLEEFRKYGFKRCSYFKFYLEFSRGINLFNPETNAKTLPETIDRTRLYHEPQYQIMQFKITGTSETMEIQIPGYFDRFLVRAFNPSEELPEDIERYKLVTGEKFVNEGELLEKHGDADTASTSGYRSKSTASRLSGSEKRKAAANSGVQTMVSGEALTGQDLVEEIERAISLRMKSTESQKSSEGGNTSIQAWPESPDVKSKISNIVITENFDRELGNVTEKVVGAKGMDVSLRSYQIEIPPNVVKTETKFKFRVSVEMNLIEYPENLIPISLPLQCSPGNVNFGAPVSIKIPTWVRKSEISPNSNPILVHVYAMRKGKELECVKSVELTSTGVVEFQCVHFCAFIAFIKKSDADGVMFALEHILFRDDRGAYTSCHFLSSDPFVNAMLKQVERNYEIIHPPTYTSYAKCGDQIPIKLLSRDPDNYRFESHDDCVLTIDESFYIVKRRESFSFLLTPESIPSRSIEFTYVIGEKKFLRRDVLKARTEVAAANIVVQKGAVANIIQEGVTVVIEKSGSTEDAPSTSQDTEISCPISVEEEETAEEEVQDGREEGTSVEQPEDILHRTTDAEEETAVKEGWDDREETSTKQTVQEQVAEEEKKIWKKEKEGISEEGANQDRKRPRSASEKFTEVVKKKTKGEETQGGDETST